jgi:aminopeptidase N
MVGMVLVLGFGRSVAAEHRIDLGPIDPNFDYHSYANTEQFRITHIELDLRVFMQQKSLDGFVGLEVRRLDPNATQLILDTKGLMIHEVSEKASDVLGATAKGQTTWVSRPFHLDKADPILGSALVVDLPRSKKSVEIIRIEYETADEATALQWLLPKETAGRHKPFLYTQSEAIGARTWIPLQDTPQARMSYTATIHTDRDLRAVMSAGNDPKAPQNGEYHFDMPLAIPSYLIALAVGDLKFQETGPRSGVWAEKPMLKAAAKEFSDTESMLEAGEKMFGAYRFTRYDILVMPPSYPGDGMQNPRLAFVTPTAIAGDKSQVSVLAHELAHAWAGNLVGNATWRDLWLNEGFSDYMESRIMSALYGAERENMEQVLGLQALRDELPGLKPADQLLAIDLRNRTPQVVFSSLPGEKGRLFLNFLDAKFGREHFDGFLRAYFEHFAFKSLTTEQFERYLKENLLDPYPGTVTTSEVDQWLHAPGIPPYALLPTTTLFATVDQWRTDWLAGRADASKFGMNWLTQQWQYFLEHMPESLTPAQMAALDKSFALTKSGNAEILQSWFKLVIAHDFQPAMPRLEEYLATVGRIRLILPLYQQMMKTEAGATAARRIYKKVRSNYHPIAASRVDAVVDLAPDETNDDQ